MRLLVWRAQVQRLPEQVQHALGMEARPVDASGAGARAVHLRQQQGVLGAGNGALTARGVEALYRPTRSLHVKAHAGAGQDMLAWPEPAR